MIKTLKELSKISDSHLIDIYNEALSYKNRFDEHFKTEIEFNDIIKELHNRDYLLVFTKQNNTSNEYDEIDYLRY